jgi:hypothetical protein
VRVLDLRKTLVREAENQESRNDSKKYESEGILFFLDSWIPGFLLGLISVWYHGFRSGWVVRV